MTARVLRLAALERKLRRLPVAAREDMRSALAKSADEIVSLARSLAPEKEGDLRRSIGWTWGRAPKGSMVLASASLGGDLTITIYAGSSEAYYARWIEFGTQKMQAQPFFYASYRALRRRARSRINRAIGKSARKVAGA